MSRYESAYGTDWDELTDQEVIERAYALGVAASLGEYLPDELDAIREEVGSSYQKSVIDLAFDEGKNEGREIDASPDNGDADDAVWNELIEEETVTVDADEVPTGGRSGLPEAMDKIEALDRPDLDSTEAVDLPDFLERD